MANFSVMDKLRSFLGINRETPRNDFRNPIWISDDEDDGDELYARGNSDIVYTGPIETEEDLFFKHMNEMFKSFRSMIGDMKLFDDDFGPAEFNLPITDHPVEESANPNDIRSYYLKPGYHNHNRRHEPPKDLDLDGKVSSQEISSLLKRNDGHDPIHIQPDQPNEPFNGKLVPSHSFCKTIITTSIRKPDGTVETRKIIKDGNEVVEEITTTQPDTRGPYGSNMDPIGPMGQIGPMGDSGMFYNNVMSEFSSLFRNYF